MEPEKIYLDVAYRDKEEMKRLGARWDPSVRKWFIRRDQDPEPFKSRILPSERTCTTFGRPPFYLAVAFFGCWKCDLTPPVATLAVSGMRKVGDDSEGSSAFTVLSFIRYLPPEIYRSINAVLPTYFWDFSNTVQHSYFMNHCSCGAVQGDFYIHNVAFSPYKPGHCRDIYLRKFRLDKEIPISAAGAPEESDELIERYATSWNLEIAGECQRFKETTLKSEGFLRKAGLKQSCENKNKSGLQN